MSITRTKLTIAALASFLGAFLSAFLYFYDTMGKGIIFTLFPQPNSTGLFIITAGSSFLLDCGIWVLMLIALVSLVKLAAAYRPARLLAILCILYLAARFFKITLIDLINLTKSGLFLYAQHRHVPLSEFGFLTKMPNIYWLGNLVQVFADLLLAVFGLILCTRRIPLFLPRTIGFFIVVAGLFLLAADFVSAAFNTSRFVFNINFSSGITQLWYYSTLVFSLFGTFILVIAKALMGVLFLKAPVKATAQAEYERAESDESQPTAAVPRTQEF